MSARVDEEWIQKRICLNSDVLEDAARLRIKAASADTVADWMEKLFDDRKYIAVTLMGIDQEFLRAEIENVEDK